MVDRRLFDVAAARTRTRRWLAVRDVARPTLVLGSSQPFEHVDTEAAERAGVEIVRRRSGGAAVLVEPGRAVWVDTWVPRADPLFEEDIGRSRTWIGRWWAATLGDEVSVHEGHPVCSRWSDVVCFAGTAAGEVTTGGRKLVGVAQWRAREGALSHSLAYFDADWPLLVRLLRLPDEAAAELAAATTTLGRAGPPRDRDAFVEALLDCRPMEAAWEVERG